MDLSQVTEEQIKKIDERTARRFRVVSEKIDLEALQEEKKSLEEILNIPKPTRKELIQFAKDNHPYFNQIDRDGIKKRLEKIDKILKI